MNLEARGSYSGRSVKRAPYNIYNIVGCLDYGTFTGEPKAETESQLLEKVKEECKKVGIDLLDNDIARCHRSSAPSRRDGKQLSAQTIIKLNNWAVRKQFQAANRHALQNKIRFSCSNNLTKMRHETLVHARRLINASMEQKFKKEERDSRQISNRDNCFTFSPPRRPVANEVCGPDV